MMPLIDKLIWQIECHLYEELSVPLLAQRCAASPFHMCRAFRQATGMSIMAYVRARRLSEAARRLAAERTDILNVALDAGYGSNEAFTRAFASYLGVLPRTVRKMRSLSTLHLMEALEMKKDMFVPVAEPEIREREAFRVVGLSARCSFEDISAIPGLWRAFNARADDVAGTMHGLAYGVCCDADETGHFRYLAGVEASDVPHGMDVVSIPKARYAVFTHRGHVADLPRTVYTIWNKALPDAGLTPASAPDFEQYNERFDVANGRGIIEVWIPVEVLPGK